MRKTRSNELRFNNEDDTNVLSLLPLIFLLLVLAWFFKAVFVFGFVFFCIGLGADDAVDNDKDEVEEEDRQGVVDGVVMETVVEVPEESPSSVVVAAVMLDDEVVGAMM